MSQTSSTIEDSPTLREPEDVTGKSYKKEFGFLPVPKHLRYDPRTPFHFGLSMNILFGFAGTFLVANLYYCQPLLIQMSQSFNVSYNEVSRIPTLIQAGYAVGVFFVAPLGDLVRRRELVLMLVALSASLTIGLAITNSIVVFEVLSFMIGFASVSPQILIPLAADLAPPNRRASAISVVISGLLLGILIARVVAGVIAEFTSWRVVYYMAVAVQYTVLLCSYLMLPDYPSKNSHMSYFGILWTMIKFAFTEPLLIQACLINVATSACFSNFWVTLTFLLGGPPYNYSTLVIGLFGLVGMFMIERMGGVAMSPLVGRLVDKLVPWYAMLASLIILVCFQAVQLAAGGINIAAVIIFCFGLDVFRQMLNVALSTSIFSISMEAASRLNALYVLSFFIGTIMGTSVGTKVFVEHGWRAGAGLSMGWYGIQFVFLLLRGPHCGRKTWFGYEGGLEARKSVVEERTGVSSEPKTSVETSDTLRGESEKEGAATAVA